MSSLFDQGWFNDWQTVPNFCIPYKCTHSCIITCTWTLLFIFARPEYCNLCQCMQEYLRRLNEVLFVPFPTFTKCQHSHLLSFAPTTILTSVKSCPEISMQRCYQHFNNYFAHIYHRAQDFSGTIVYKTYVLIFKRTVAHYQYSVHVKPGNDKQDILFMLTKWTDLLHFFCTRGMKWLDLGEYIVPLFSNTPDHYLSAVTGHHKN